MAARLQFQPATRRQVRLRLALYGPSGSGKTWSALAIATGLAKPDEGVAIIDTEAGSSSMYADKFGRPYDMLALEDRSPEGYIAAIRAAEQQGYVVGVIDSLSHAWQELLEWIDRQKKGRGGGFNVWGDATPKQKALVNAITHSRMHWVCTMRANTEWSLDKDDRTGKTTPTRVGLKPEQRGGLEYEFDVVAALSPTHTMTFEKDRVFHQLQDAIVNLPDAELGRRMRAWCEEGEPELASAAPAPAPEPSPAAEPARQAPATPKAKAIQRVQAWAGVDRDDLADAVKTTAKAAGHEVNGEPLTDPQWSQILAWCEARDGQDWWACVNPPADPAPAEGEHRALADDDIPF